jgi:tetratricopeptide (TPR) repeat protein
MLAAYRQGGVRGASAVYARAFEAVNAAAAADIAADPRWTIRLLSCAVLFFSPALALPRVERAWRLAREQEIRDEEAPSRANLGLVYLELGDRDEAKRHLHACLALLAGAPRSVVLNNLALAVSPSDRTHALRLLASSLAQAERADAVAILSNQAAIQAADRPVHLPDFSSLVAWATEACAPPVVDRVRFNHVQALLEQGKAKAALQAADVFAPREEDHRDGALVVSQWARLRRDVYRELGMTYPPVLDTQAALLDRSAERQAWLYRTRWALCPLPLCGPTAAGKA